MKMTMSGSHWIFRFSALLAGCKERVPPPVQRAAGGAEEELPAGVGQRGAQGEDSGAGGGQGSLTKRGGQNQRGELQHLQLCHMSSALKVYENKPQVQGSVDSST